MTQKPSNAWAWVLGAAVVNFEGLAGFIIFLLLLSALLLWLVYKFALAILPALMMAIGLLVLLFLPVHVWARATIRDRSTRRIASKLQEIRELEQLHVPRDQILPLEQRVREAAQAMIDTAYTAFRGVTKQLRRADSSELRQTQRSLRQELADLKLTYGVAPESSWGSRFIRLHLECDWIRWLAENPGAARMILLGVLAVLTTVMAALLREL